MITIIDPQIGEGVYEVNVKVTFKGITTSIHTTFNNLQPESSINRALRNANIKKAEPEKVEVIMIRRMGDSWFKNTNVPADHRDEDC